MKPFSELFTNNFFGITFVAFICTQSIDLYPVANTVRPAVDASEIIMPA